MAEISIVRSGIYSIRNTSSGRVYVGSGEDIRRRWYSHRYLLRNGRHHSRSLQRSWDKHGPQAFQFSILELVPDRSLLIEREQFWIDLLQASSPQKGFNSYPAGSGPRGIRWSEEMKAQASQSKKGRKIGPMSESHRRNLSIARQGKKASLETRMKMSIAHKGRKHPPRPKEWRDALSASKSGRKWTPEARRKILEGQRKSRRGNQLSLPFE